MKTIYKWWLQWGRSNNDDDLQMMTPTEVDPIMKMIYKWWLQWGRSNKWWFTNDDSNEVDPIMMMIYKWWLQWGRSNNDDDLQMMTPMR